MFAFPQTRRGSGTTTWAGAWALGCLLLAGVGAAEGIVAFDPTAPSALWDGIAVQHFTVPPSCTGTKLEFLCDTTGLPAGRLPGLLPPHSAACVAVMAAMSVC